MNLQEYQLLTSRTNADLGSKAINAAHVTLGIVGEFAEFHLACQEMNIDNIKKEGADIYWYISELANLHNIPLQINECPYWPWSIDIMVGDIAEMSKKYLAYNKPIDEFKLSDYLNHLLFYINLTFKEYEIDFEECLDMNIEKLQKRFPEKFSAELAIAKGDEQ